MSIRVADYIADYLAERGIVDVFTVTGGGAMFLNDAFGHHPRLTCTYFHHEQACAIAAEGYARVSNRLCAVCVTTGPGGTNALTGVLGAWLDSIPLLVISGQVKFETTVRSLPNLKLRQLGDQEFDIASCARTMTKYAQMVVSPKDIRYQLDKAIHISTNGRPGPVWLDIPQNVQSTMIEPDELTRYNPAVEQDEIVPEISEQTTDEVLARLKTANRPVVYIGMGIHLSHSEELLQAFVEQYHIPVVAGFAAQDCLPYDHPLYVGRPGTIGDRAGNYAVQNADLLLVLGCRLNVRQTSYAFDAFAREAYRIMVDIDENELKKPALRIDMGVHGDVEQFLRKMQAKQPTDLPSYEPWIDWCTERKLAYPVVLPDYEKSPNKVNPYCLMDELSRQLPENSVIVAANATACICSFQAIKIKKGQRLFSNSGAASMGYDLPAAIGACIARGKRRVICLAGDGSLQMNLQELQTVVHNKLPITIFYLNNNGYHSIRQTQHSFFGEYLVGCQPDCGVSFPNMEKISFAYGLPYLKCGSQANLHVRVCEVLATEGPCVCEVILDETQPFAPKVSSMRLDDGRMVSRPLEDLAPFLPRDEYLRNLIISPLEEQ